MSLNMRKDSTVRFIVTLLSDLTEVSVCMHGSSMEVISFVFYTVAVLV